MEVIARSMSECLELMIEKSARLGELVDKGVMLSDIEKSTTEFLQ